MEFYLEELECDWGESPVKSYGSEEITPELIKEIKAAIMDENSGICMVYAMDNNDNWLSMDFIEGWAAIDIVFENPAHTYIFYNKKYEGVKDSEFLEFGQDVVPRVAACDDMLLAANIFEEWALRGKLYSTTWVDNEEGDAFDDYYAEKESENYYRLYLTGFGENKTKTIVFVKKYFRESDFDQARKRTEKFPLLLCVAAESEVLLLEEKLQKIGAAYKKEKISDNVYMELYYANPEDTLWDKLDAYLRL